ncbi:unnamed protein product [Acanthoscelides obtectus]|uniref:Uncharacterized protein n=1 Tax=Acanthoscelides obtectus TaxID=200917 RepID=A0A9P0KIY1_ACAOB|nr:unnamed protein product [Acanthoscelides obtectus]CAK1636053.1 hypothetical protein AOBTE_LOCUS9710 [Acanthoscelides obtectus]
MTLELVACKQHCEIKYRFYCYLQATLTDKGVLLVEEMDGPPRELCLPALANDLANSIRNSFSGFDVTRAVLQSFLYRSQALITDISRTHVKIGKYHLFDLLGLRYRPSNELALSTPPMCLLYCVITDGQGMVTLLQQSGKI